MDEAPRIALGDVDAINNLDTARMALRWALERLRALEAAKLEAADRSSAEAKWRAEAELEVRRLKSALAAKASEAEERERYYRQIEGFLSLRLGGQVDLAALAQRQLETERLREDLETRLGSLEREFASRRQALELEYQRLNQAAREAAQRGARELDATLAKRHEDFEKEHADALVALKERELRIARQEEQIAERQRRLEDHAERERLRLDAQARELDAQFQERVRGAERLLDERKASQESAFLRERAMLQQEIASLRQRLQETAPALLAAERAAHDAADRLAQSEEAERRARVEARLALADRLAAQERTRSLESQLEAEIVKRADLEARVLAAETELKRAVAERDALRKQIGS